MAGELSYAEEFRTVNLDALKKDIDKVHPHALQAWAVATATRRGHNKPAIAVANKLARII